MKNRVISAKEILFLLEQMNSPFVQLDTIVQDFEEVGIDYCIIGGMSLPIHNYKRQTHDVDILVSKESFLKIEKYLIGQGYTRRPGSSKNLYFYTGTKKIPIDILVEGDNESGFILPNPQKIRYRTSGAWYIDLPQLINFKLNAKEPRHINDVINLIKANKLDKTFAKKLPVSIRQEFLKLIN